MAANNASASTEFFSLRLECSCQSTAKKNLYNETMNQKSHQKLLQVLSYTTQSEKSYSGSRYQAGYHTHTIDGQTYSGQRNPAKRFEAVPYDFKDKVVFDIGCKQGAMLFHLKDQISEGYGIDYDPKMINACNRIKSHIKTSHLHFYVFDLEKEPLAHIENFLETPPDICFLLSVCMWLPNWRQIIQFCRHVAPALLFESNGNNEQQNEQISYLKTVYPRVTILAESSDDDPIQKSRKLVLANLTS